MNLNVGLGGKKNHVFTHYQMKKQKNTKNYLTFPNLTILWQGKWTIPYR